MSQHFYDGELGDHDLATRLERRWAREDAEYDEVPAPRRRYTPPTASYPASTLLIWFVAFVSLATLGLRHPLWIVAATVVGWIFVELTAAPNVRRYSPLLPVVVAAVFSTFELLGWGWYGPQQATTPTPPPAHDVRGNDTGGGAAPATSVPPPTEAPQVLAPPEPTTAPAPAPLALPQLPALLALPQLPTAVPEPPAPVEPVAPPPTAAPMPTSVPTAVPTSLPRTSCDGGQLVVDGVQIGATCGGGTSSGDWGDGGGTSSGGWGTP